jgi:hypothetical protein
MYTIAIGFEDGRAGVFLYEMSTLVGGWVNTADIRAACIAAEVLKVALPDARVIPMPRHEKEAMDWWHSVQTFQGVLADAQPSKDE